MCVSDAAAEMEKSWRRGGQWLLAGLARYHWNVGRERPAARRGSPAGLPGLSLFAATLVLALVLVHTGPVSYWYM